MLKRFGRWGAVACAGLMVVAVGALAQAPKVAFETPVKTTPAPQIEGVNLIAAEDATDEDKAVSLEALKGHVVVIDLWATWCGPCVAEMPDLTKFQKKHTKEKFTYIGVSVDAPADEGDVVKLAKKKELNYPVIMGNREMLQALTEAIGKRISGIPTKIVVDREGNVAFFVVGSPSIDQASHTEYEARLLRLIAQPIPVEEKVESPS